LHPREFLQQTLDELLILFRFETADSLKIVRYLDRPSVSRTLPGLNNRIGEHAVLVILHFATRAARPRNFASSELRHTFSLNA